MDQKLFQANENDNKKRSGSSSKDKTQKKRS